MERTLPPEKAAELADLLATGTSIHDYPITYDKAHRLGLPVRADMPAEIMELMGLFPQPMRRQPAVEYLPERRSIGETKKGAGVDSVPLNK